MKTGSISGKWGRHKSRHGDMTLNSVQGHYKDSWSLKFATNKEAIGGSRDCGQYGRGLGGLEGGVVMYHLKNLDTVLGAVKSCEGFWSWV